MPPTSYKVIDESVRGHVIYEKIKNERRRLTLRNAAREIGSDVGSRRADATSDSVLSRPDSLVRKDDSQTQHAF